MSYQKNAGALRDQETTGNGVIFIMDNETRKTFTDYDELGFSLQLIINFAG